MSWLNVALWVGLPFLISKAREYFKKTTPRPPRPKTSLDTFSTFFLVFVACANILVATIPSQNLLRDLRVHPESPSFVVRNNFRQYMSAKFPGWTQEGAYDLRQADPATRDRVEELERLYELLKSTDNRRMYLRYGHDAFTKCNWCVEPSDFMIYIVPSLVLSYAMTMVFIGLGTLTWRKTQWRTYGAVALTGIAVVDAYVIFLSEAALVDRHGVSSSLYDTMYGWRRWSFAALALAAAFIDKKDEWTEADILKDVLAKNQVIYNRAQAFRLARAATLSDGTLRRKFMEHYKEKEVLNDAVSRDLEYKETREKVLQKYNLNQLITEAQALCEHIVQAAIDEGVVSGVDRRETDASEEGTASSDAPVSEPTPTAANKRK
ncbi:uncharacterized protein SPPG_06561 [Spizellomyces punctatus DAOM BR117]|uniref:Uncharacterized protein n=1 Tax=Spizellomyces punctatus (strain DAOM BR117) TaxID=645134 RepID=A0A0L0HAI0_SPIPD|nr:uncharacterized protein SPPG_06561 [Spizellomyces punctatus DAOM BR117]KNC98157.1 hypothetical protein SPPG_06561 [Spizellomyces punctatus DAOM BR117]|eukprot:XP_016606197.1 hypothetical protein SPPG_06561 [Spizellomyces punctatus DAOM BR117]